jgi:iron-sulfur cluster repair protein YtfE (RIC family)
MDPTIICREVFEKTKHEHDLLRQKLGDIHEVLAGIEIGAEAIASLLGDFQNDLQVHFSNEESDGFFNELTAHSPHLLSRADKLCVEHGQLLHTVKELCRFATAGSKSSAWWSNLGAQWHAFSRELMHHESEENKLLQQAYQEEIGTFD